MVDASHVRTHYAELHELRNETHSELINVAHVSWETHKTHKTHWRGDSWLRARAAGPRVLDPLSFMSFMSFPLDVSNIYEFAIEFRCETHGSCVCAREHGYFLLKNTSATHKLDQYS